jgi:hypothetical protein
MVKGKQDSIYTSYLHFSISSPVSPETPPRAGRQRGYRSLDLLYPIHTQFIRSPVLVTTWYQRHWFLRKFLPPSSISLRRHLAKLQESMADMLSGISLLASKSDLADLSRSVAVDTSRITALEQSSTTSAVDWNRLGARHQFRWHRSSFSQIGVSQV